MSGRRRRFMAQCALVSAVALISLAAARRVAPLAFAPTRAVTAPDTVTVFGPMRFVAERGNRAHFIEQLDVPAALDSRYILRVTAEPGVARAAVRLDGAQILGPADFARSHEPIEHSVQLTAESVIEVEVQGKPGAAVEIAVLAIPTAEFVIYETEVITERRVTELAGQFDVPADGAAPYRLELVNGLAEADRASSIQITLNGELVVGSADLNQTVAGLSREVDLEAGINTLGVRISGPAGARGHVRILAVDGADPVLDVTTPAHGARTSSQTVVVAGTVDDRTAIQVVVNGIAAALAGTSFTVQVPLDEGDNVLDVVATDAAGNVSQQSLTVQLDTEPPMLALTSPVDGITTDAVTVTVAGNVSDGGPVTLGLNGAPLAADAAGAFATDVPLAIGLNVITVTATDDLGNSTSVVRQVTREEPGEEPPPEEGLPPDPADVAPDVNATVATNMNDAVAFLYTGDAPIQTGVAPGTIDPLRVAVLRGRVLDRSSRALPGVSITVLDHPELGSTLSRADGLFDIAVNAGGTLVVNYEKTGYLPAQRNIVADRQDFGHAPDVVLIPVDPVVTQIDLATLSTVRVAEGSVVADPDGTRQARLMFEPGTTAEMVMPDGSMQALGTLSVRATEYTVGGNGQATMPGELPPQTGYTYAVEFSVDEAMSAGARDVRFSQPVPTYVDNFLDFPVGTRVPAGYYDRTIGKWVPADDGLVIGIIDTSGGIAAVDMTGDGAADDIVMLETIGLDADELARLAELYTPGTELWRVEVDHFTPWDYNWPFGPPLDAVPPPFFIPETDRPEDESCEQAGSIIDCHNQVLGERTGITGTPYSLNYRSDRVPGRAAANTSDITLTDSSVPSSVKRVELTVDIAGRRFVESFAPTPDLTTRFTWDGRDAYGRVLQGRVPATIRVGYVYDGVFRSPSGNRSFGNAGEVIMTASRTRSEVTMTRQYSQLLSSQTALSGWTLDVHHTYDPTGHVLHMGDGTRRSAEGVPAVMTVLAGRDSTSRPGAVRCFYPEPVRATETLMNSAWPLTTGHDGAIYFSDSRCSVIQRLGPDGMLVTIAGRDSTGYSGDGGRATEALLDRIGGLAFGPDGSLYMTQLDYNVIRRIDPQGIITTIAGSSEPCDYDTDPTCGTSGPALEARLNSPEAITVDHLGNVYFSDYAFDPVSIYRVTPDGMMTPVVHAEEEWWNNPECDDDTVHGMRACVDYFYDMVAGPDGSIYFAEDGSRLRRLRPDGMLTTVAGMTEDAWRDQHGSYPDCPDVPPRVRSATEPLCVSSYSIAAAPDGGFYFLSEASIGAWIDHVRHDGIVVRISGQDHDATRYFGGENGPVGDAVFWGNDLAVDANGSLVVGTSGAWGVRGQTWPRIVRIGTPMPGFSAGQIAIASVDGTQLYQLAADGRHLRTLHALTGDTIYEFGYDDDGHLVSVRGIDGGITSIERDANGNPTAIVAPFGQRTLLAVNGDGYIASITDPTGSAWAFEYTAEGLLTRATDAVGNASTYEYDADGRLVRAVDPAGGEKTLVRQETADGYTVTYTSPTGHVTTYAVQRPGAGTQRRTSSFAGGAQASRVSGNDGGATMMLPDGRVVTRKNAPDARFGMQAPLRSAFTLTSPDGLVVGIERTRTVQLDAPGDPLSLRQQTDTRVVNGNTFGRSWGAQSRTVSGSTPEGRSVAYTLDEEMRVAESRSFGFAPTTYDYLPNGRIGTRTIGEGAAARVFSYSYDVNGNLAQLVSPNGGITQLTHDAAGRLLRQVHADSTGVDFTYDANGNLTSLTVDGGATHSFAWSPLGLPVSYTAPDVGNGVDATVFEYDDGGRLARVALPDGSDVVLRRDAAGRLEEVGLAGGAVQMTYVGATTRVASIEAPSGVGLEYEYDGAIMLSETWTGPVSGSVSRTYDENMRRTRLIVGSDSVVMSHDRDGLLVAAGALTLTRNPQHHLATGLTLGGYTESWSYNEFAELATLNGSHGGTALFDAAYTRDAVGRVRRIEETILGESTVREFGYDAAGRLTQVQRDGIAVASYEYDANGNRLHAVTGTGVTTGSYDARDRLVAYGDAAYQYSASGTLGMRIIATDTTRYDYDALGNLRAVMQPDGTTIEYVIDGRSRRVGRIVNGVLMQSFLYQDQLRPVAELDGAGAVVSRFVYGSLPNVPDYMVRGSETYRLIADHVGSVRLVVNVTTGDVAQRIDYDAFGRVIQDTNPGFQPFGFGGGLYDPQTGLLRFGARDYDAYTGRWTAPDPIGFAEGMTNLYAYVENDPVNRTDMSGLNPGAGGCEFVNLGAPLGVWDCSGTGMTPLAPPPSPFEQEEELAPMDVEMCAADGSTRPGEDCHADVPYGGRIGQARLNGRANCDLGQSCAPGHGLTRVVGGGKYDKVCTPISGSTVDEYELGLLEEVTSWLSDLVGGEQRFDVPDMSGGGVRG